MNSAVVSNFVSTTENSKIGALGSSAVADISQELRQLLADTFTLYVKTKGFHWHITGRHFRDYHLLLDEQAEQIFAIIDDIAERARKIGGTTLHSVAEIAKYKRLSDETVSASPREMLLALAEDNARLWSVWAARTSFVRGAETSAPQVLSKSGSTRRNAAYGS